MQRKIFLNVVVVLLVGVIICGILSSRVVEKNLISNIERDLTTESGLVRELVGESLISNGSDINEYIKKIKQTTNARVTILDILGNVIVDTEKEASTMDNHFKRAEVAAALKGEVGKSIRYSYTLKVDLMYIAQPIYKGSNIIGVVRLAKPLYEIKELINKLYMNIFIAVLMGLLAASLLGYRMSILVTRPIKEITYAAERISKGQFDKQINISSKDEVGILANSINDMASELNETIMSLQDKNLKLEAIMSSVVNGIIA
ncbi:MAG TPA: HAMP domain-containing protein, partial [Negativicutes bacterium]|nr:HAMP domain-containing protein [Negativicutes bacterium]